MAENDGASDAAATDQAAQADGQQQQGDRTFSQADVDRIVQDRVARVKSEPPKDYDDLRAKAAKLEELEQANQSELEKAQARAEKAEQERQTAIERANARLIEAAVLAQATALKAIKPEHMHRLIDTDTVTVADDGQVTGVEEAVKGFLEANPEYVGKTAAPPGAADQGARNGGLKQLTREDIASMSPEQVRSALAEGRLTNVLGGS